MAGAHFTNLNILVVLYVFANHFRTCFSLFQLLEHEDGVRNGVKDGIDVLVSVPKLLRVAKIVAKSFVVLIRNERLPEDSY